MTQKRNRGRPRSFHDKTEQNTINSLDRAMMILEALAQAGGGTLTELATGLQQSPSTAYRVLTTLESRGIVEIDKEKQTWHVGAGAFRIGSAFLRRTNLAERARPIMQELMETTGETANLGIESGDKVLFVSQVETHESIRAFFPPGTLSAMHASGIGKALLSTFHDDRLEALLATSLEIFTGRTLTDPEVLREDLRRTKERGYSFDDEERSEGMRCVASPVFNAMGQVVAGLSISGPTARITPGRVPVLGQSVRDAAITLSQRLGYE